MPASVPIDSPSLQQAAVVIRSLGHPLRLRLLEALEAGEQSVGDLQAYAGVSQSEVSRQLSILRGHGIVTARRDGPYMRYSISEPKVHAILECIRGCGT